MDLSRLTRIVRLRMGDRAAAGAMRVPGVIYAERGADPRRWTTRCCEQVANVATLPGIVEASYAMPDAHWGYGFPIGGVAAFDPDEGGVVSAGGVGFDISCGVRTPADRARRARDIEPVQAARSPTRSSRAFPAGVGSTGAHPPRRRRDGRDAARRRALGGRARLRAAGRSRAHRGARRDGGAEPGSVSDAGQDAPARRDGHARLRQPLPRGAGGRRDLRRGDRRGLRPRTRATSSSASTAARAASATRSAPSSCARWRSRRRQHGIALPDRELACAPIRSDGRASAISARCAPRSTARSPTARSSRTWRARRSRAVLPAGRRSTLLYDVSHNTCKVEEHARRRQAARALRASQGRDARVRPGPSRPAAPRCAPTGQPVLIGGTHGHGVLRPRRHARERRRARSARPATAPAAA